MDHNNISCMWQQIEDVLSIAEHEREINDVRNICQWFRDRSSLFHSLDTESLCGVVKGSKLERFKADHVIVHQGEIGICFYIIVRGSCSVYAKKVITTTTDQNPNGVNEPVLHDVNVAKGAKERGRFGQELTVLRQGRCFGEVSVVAKNVERNATVIADEASVLICIDKELYSKYVGEESAIEIAHRSSFISMHPLFRGWPMTYRNLLSENFQYRKVKFGETLVHLGDPLDYVYFIIEGQVKITTNPIHHKELFPKLLARIKDEQTGNDDNEANKEDEFDYFEKINTIERRNLRQKEGFFASELRYREVDICTVGSQGIIGDIETIMELDRYTVTIECIQEMSLYEMDLSSFIKIIVKKNPETYEKMRRSVYEKIHYRNSLFQKGLPIYRALLTFFAAPKPKDNRKQILNAFKQKKAKEKPVTLNFFVEMSKGRSTNWVNKKKQFQPVHRPKYETKQSNLPDENADNTNNDGKKKTCNKLWAVGKIAGKVKTQHQKTKKNQTNEAQQFTADEYKELKKKLQAAGKTA